MKMQLALKNGRTLTLTAEKGKVGVNDKPVGCLHLELANWLLSSDVALSRQLIVTAKQGGFETPKTIIVNNRKRRQNVAISAYAVEFPAIEIAGYDRIVTIKNELDGRFYTVPVDRDVLAGKAQHNAETFVMALIKRLQVTLRSLQVPLTVTEVMPDLDYGIADFDVSQIKAYESASAESEIPLPLTESGLSPDYLDESKFDISPKEYGETIASHLRAMLDARK